MNDVFFINNKDLGVFVCYNTSAKIYKNGLVKLKRISYDVFKGRVVVNSHNGSSTIEDLAYYKNKHLFEKREKILDLALNNDNWEYFVTLTFSDSEIGEYSHDKALKFLRRFIDNQQHKNKHMKYLLVAELHKSGRIHFHGLFSNVGWELVPARYPKSNRLIKKNGKQIYNLKDYKYGFTTVSYVESQDKVSSYISKYITKDLLNLKFKKAFWYSRNLDKPLKTYHYLNDKLKNIYKDNVLYSAEFDRSYCTTELLNYRS